MNSISHVRAYMRSLATRDDNTSLSAYVQEAIDICKAAGFDFIILESAGVGQSDASVLDYCDVSMYVMTPEYGAASQLEKINMLDYADVVCINKFDKAGALDALHDVRGDWARGEIAVRPSFGLHLRLLTAFAIRLPELLLLSTRPFRLVVWGVRFVLPAPHRARTVSSPVPRESRTANQVLANRQ